MDSNHNYNHNHNHNQCCVLCKGKLGQLFKVNDSNDSNDYIHIYCALYSTNVWINKPPPLLDNNDDIYKLAILNCHANSIVNNSNTTTTSTSTSSDGIEILPSYYMDINETISKSTTTKCCSLGCNNNIGATLKCSRKYCNNYYHIPCAIEICENVNYNVCSFLFHGRMISRKNDKKVLIDRAFICNNHQSWIKDEDWINIALYIHDNPQLKNNSLSIDIDAFPLHLRRILMTILELEIYDININNNLSNSIENTNNDNDNITLTDVYNLKRDFNKGDIISWHWKYPFLENNQIGQCGLPHSNDNRIDSSNCILNSTENINDHSNTLIKDQKQGKIYNKTKKMLLVEKEIYCTVCGEINNNISDCLLQCIDCNVHVHKSCVQNSYYEICGFEIDSTSFKCISCTKKNDKKCCLCMCDDDNTLYMLPTTKGCFFWAHCLCIYAHQQSKLILCPEKQSCIICKASDVQGANNFQLIKCGEETCQNLFHPTCAFIEGYEFSSSHITRIDLTDGILIDPIELIVYCYDCMSKRNVSLRKRVNDSYSESVSCCSDDDDENLLENENVNNSNWDGTVRHMIGNIEVSSNIEIKKGDDTIMTMLGAMKGLINWEKTIHHRTFLHEEVVKGINKYGSNDNIVVMNLSHFDNSLQQCLRTCWALLTTKVPNYKYVIMVLEHNLQDLSILSNDSFNDSNSEVFMIGIRPYKEDNLIDVINERQKPSQIQLKEKTCKAVLKQKFPIELEEQISKKNDSKDSPKKLPDRIDIDVKRTSPRKSELSPRESVHSNSMTQYVRTLLEKPNFEPVSIELEENLTPLNEDDQPYDISIFDNDNEPEYNPSESITTDVLLDIASIRNAFYVYLSSLPQTKCSLTLAKEWFKRKQGMTYDAKTSMKKLLDIDDKISKDGRFMYKNNVFVDNEHIEAYITIPDNKNAPNNDIKKQTEINRGKYYSTSAPITDNKTERIQNTSKYSDPKNERYRSTSSNSSSAAIHKNGSFDSREKRDQRVIGSDKERHSRSPERSRRSGSRDDRDYNRDERDYDLRHYDYERDIARDRDRDRDRRSRSYERSRRSNDDDYDDKRHRRSRSRDRHDRYDDRHDRYDDRHDRYDDRHDRYDDRHDRYDENDDRRRRRSSSRERNEQSRSRERDNEHKQKTRKQNEASKQNTRLGLLAKKGLSNLPAWMTSKESISQTQTSHSTDQGVGTNSMGKDTKNNSNNSSVRRGSYPHS